MFGRATEKFCLPAKQTDHELKAVTFRFILPSDQRVGATLLERPMILAISSINTEYRNRA
jgi:hypothetical protein